MKSLTLKENACRRIIDETDIAINTDLTDTRAMFSDEVIT